LRTTLAAFSRTSMSILSSGAVSWAGRGAQNAISHNAQAASARTILSIACMASGFVFHVGLGSVAARGGLGMPDALVVLPLDDFGAAGGALLARGKLGGGQRLVVAGERFREDVADLVGPAA